MDFGMKLCCFHFTSSRVCAGNRDHPAPPGWESTEAVRGGKRGVRLAEPLFAIQESPLYGGAKGIPSDRSTVQSQKSSISSASAVPCCSLKCFFLKTSTLFAALDRYVSLFSMASELACEHRAKFR